MKRNKNITVLVTAAMIAALYIVLGFLSQTFGLASGAVQLRLSEALTLLPAFTFGAIPGITIGCLLFNLLSGAALPDIIFGTLATLLGGLGTYFIGTFITFCRRPVITAGKKVLSLKKLKLANIATLILPVPPILANTLIIPLVLQYAYGWKDAFWYLALTVGIGEFLSCGFLGFCLFFALKPIRKFIFL